MVSGDFHCSFKGQTAMFFKLLRLFASVHSSSPKKIIQISTESILTGVHLHLTTELQLLGLFKLYCIPHTSLVQKFFFTSGSFLKICFKIHMDTISACRRKHCNKTMKIFQKGLLHRVPSERKPFSFL